MNAPQVPTQAQVPAFLLAAGKFAKLGIPIELIEANTKACRQTNWENTCTTDLKEIAAKITAKPDWTNYMLVAKGVPNGHCFLDDDGGIRAIYESQGGVMEPTLKQQSCSWDSAKPDEKVHYIYKHSPASLAFFERVKKAYIGEPNQNGKGEFWSLRLNNAYIVGAGSWAPPDKDKPNDVNPYTIACDVQPIPIPDGLLNFLIQRWEAQNRASQSVPTSAEDVTIVEGSRNIILTKIAGELRAKGLNENSIETALSQINQERCNPPLPDSEIKTISHSIGSKPHKPDVYAEGVTVRSVLAAQEQAAQATTTQPSARKLVLVRADNMKPKHLRWFWENRIFADKANVIYGEPGLGKGFIGADFIARMTTGTDFFDSPNQNAPCDAVICCAEDSPEETIVPRLMVAGADRTRIHFLKVRQESADTVEEGLMRLDTDLPALAQMVQTNPEIRIILIDPLATYMGELDPNKDKDVRPVYTKLAQFAETHDICFILIAHPNKNEVASAINRLSGAKALTSVFRNTWLVEKDPDDNTKRLMLSVKGNLAAEQAKKGLKFQIENVADTGIMADDKTIKNIGKLVWLESTDKTADEAVVVPTKESQSQDDNWEGDEGVCAVLLIRFWINLVP